MWERRQLGQEFQSKTNEKVDGGKKERVFIYNPPPQNKGLSMNPKIREKYHRQVAKLEHTK